MITENDRGYCQRNLKPLVVLLVLLVAATIGWAVVLRQKGELNLVRRRVGAPVAGTGPRQAVAGPVVQSVPAATPVVWNVDAITKATPNGGIRLIAQTGDVGPPAGLVDSPGTAARMRLAAAVRPQGRNTFNTISALLLPSVVSVHATRNQPANATIDAEGAAAFVNPFDGIPEKLVGTKAFESVGSGVIVDSRGFVLTNYHVISQATDILASVSGDGEGDFLATVAAVDPGADLALLKLSNASPLPEARLGNSDAVKVGDWVLAFGSPFGLDQTVTQGIISNKREALVVGGTSFGAMLQTDAPINRGSSGGPLVNLQAEVIGINSAIYGPNGVFSGMGFAIPVNRAKAFLAENSNVLEQ
jgi:serine protease Do